MNFRRRSPFLITGILSYGLAMISVCLLTRWMHMEIIPVLIMSVAVAFSFFVLAFTGKIIMGKEEHVLYRYFIFCGATTTFILWICNLPALFYLDAYAIGFGIFHCIGRIGCYRAGCCHGKPSAWGAIYYQNTNSPYYGVRLLPVQLIESFFLLIIATTCITLLFQSSYQPGKIISWYIVLYGTVRFFLELFRGDTDRKMIAWFSEAQWTAIITITTFVLIKTLIGSSLFEPQITIASIFLCCVIPAGMLLRQPFSKAFSAIHFYEIASAIQHAKSIDDKPQIITTSAGVQIGLSFTDNESRSSWYCSLSYAGVRQKEMVMTKTFRIIRQLKFARNEFEFVKGNHGVQHYIFSTEIHDRKKA